MSFKEALLEKIDITDSYLRKYFPKEDNLQKTVYDAMEYSLFAGGKRIRPVLAMSVCEMLGKDADIVMPFACALEMIHTYSLIHDDLPSMDNDDFRRGKPTCHKVYGEAMAVLAGDGLLNLAFETAIRYSQCSAEKTLDCLYALSSASGAGGMIGGQVIDLEYENKKADAETLNTMHSLKTGALISAAAELGAICADAPRADYLRILEFSKCLGIAFQIKDDILDVEGDSDVLGKPTGSDAINDKSTFVSIYGLEKSKEMLNDYTNKAIELIRVYNERSLFLNDLAMYLLNRNK